MRLKFWHYRIAARFLPERSSSAFFKIVFLLYCRNDLIGTVLFQSIHEILIHRGVGYHIQIVVFQDENSIFTAVPF